MYSWYLCPYLILVHYGSIVYVGSHDLVIYTWIYNVLIRIHVLSQSKYIAQIIWYCKNYSTDNLSPHPSKVFHLSHPSSFILLGNFVTRKYCHFSYIPEVHMPKEFLEEFFLVRVSFLGALIHLTS